MTGTRILIIWGQSHGADRALHHQLTPTGLRVGVDIMKVEKLTVTAEITRDSDTEEFGQLMELYRSGESVFGLVDQFSFMPFKVTRITKNGDKATFHLLMTVR